MIKSAALRDAFTELAELPKAAAVKISVEPQSPSSDSCCFQLSAHAEAAVCTIEFAACSSALVEVECNQNVEADYHLAILQQTLRAMHSAAETFIRMNSEGMMSVQHLVEIPSGAKAFVDALVTADEI